MELANEMNQRGDNTNEITFFHDEMQGISLVFSSMLVSQYMIRLQSCASNRDHMHKVFDKFDALDDFRSVH